MPASAEGRHSSYVDLFAPPDEQRQGVFGLCCALSANARYIEAALERFTGLGPQARARGGQLAIVLLTDPRDPRLPPIAGLEQGHPHRWPEKTELLHAKVALLGFGPSRTGEPDFLRLVVSTGNWTLGAANHELNLVWTCELRLGTRSADARDAERDLRQTARFFRALLSDAAGGNGYYALPRAAQQRVDALLARCGLTSEDDRAAADARDARFISTLTAPPAAKSSAPSTFLKGSIGRQVIRSFERRGVPRGEATRGRNLLFCGSGFFENAREGESGPPEVLTRLCAELQEAKVLAQTLKPEDRWLAVNPETAGAVGVWLSATDEDALDWTICRPWRSAEEGRRGKGGSGEPARLHAKYVFVGRCGERCTSGLLYLGSGNLSLQGFALSPGANGNVEAGVVLETEDMDERILCASLGIHPEEEAALEDFDVERTGEEAETKPELQQRPPPLVGLTWDAQQSKLALEWLAGEDREGCELRWGAVVIPIDATAETVAVPPEAPRVGRVNLLRGNERWELSVFTAAGDYCRPPAERRGFDEVLARLADFPGQAWDDEAEEPARRGDGGDDGDRPPFQSHGEDETEELRRAREAFPIHRAMALVEALAEGNQRVEAGQMPDWVAHLRQVLLEELQPEAAKAFASLGWNVLAPLHAEPGFAPRAPTSDYEVLLREVEAAWATPARPLLPSDGGRMP
ncbi:MAG: hypothetical protein IT371_20685 [Deltaproteobacteria bacterium]|nr:hypothetical protein [Deltaproteobacteria bacterium]